MSQTCSSQGFRSACLGENSQTCSSQGFRSVYDKDGQRKKRRVCTEATGWSKEQAMTGWSKESDMTGWSNEQAMTCWSSE